jgi:hypothetical protein
MSINEYRPTEWPTKYKPQYKHSCEHCVPLGRTRSGERCYDIYYCKCRAENDPFIVVRWGDDFHHNRGLEFSRICIQDDAEFWVGRCLYVELLWGTT